MNVRDSDPDLVRTLRELGSGGVPVADAGRAEYQRERVIRVIGRALQSVRSAHRRGRRTFGIVAAAALLALAVGGARLALGSGTETATGDVATGAVAARSVFGTVTVTGVGVPHAAVVGDLFRGGEAVTTALDSKIDLSVESGVAALGASSHLEFMTPNQKERRVRLSAGRVNVDLPVKLRGGRHLVVETPDVDVLVVGTAFSVGVDRQGTETTTRVNVQRGTVWVVKGGRQEAVLVAGQSWRSGAPVAATTTAPAESSATAPKASVRASRSGDSGTLADENRMFQAGLSARNAGDAQAAADAFGALLARYPRSVLAEQALAERFRALGRAGNTSSAAAAARRYLASYPRGFARVEAERVTRGSLGAR